MARILLLNGPNLNLLGEREPEIYGRTTLKEIEARVTAKAAGAGHRCDCFQSNHEGQLIDWLHEKRSANFLLLNAGGLTHTGIALRDAVAAIDTPFVEIHISNIYRREPFRARSYFSDLAVGLIVGLGPQGYEFAAEFAINHLARAGEVAG